MTIARDMRSKRLTQRVTLPLSVSINGWTRDVSDWSLGGFGLSLDAPLAHGARLAVRLAFPVGSAELGFTTTCEVMYAGADGRHGFRFVDLTPDQLQVLRQMWIAATTGQVLPLDACLTPADPPDSLALAPDAAPPPTPSRMVGYGVLLALGALVLVGLAVSLHARLFVIRADFAAVTTPVVRLRTPVDGVLNGAALPPDTVVTVGTTLFDLAGPEMAAEIEQQEAELNRLAASVRALRHRREEMRGFFADYSALAESALRRTEAERNQAQASLELADHDLSRWEELAKAGFAAQARLDQAQQRYTQAEQGLAGTEAAVELDGANLRMAQQGRWFSGSRVEGAEPAKLDEDLRQAETAHGLQARRLAALTEQRAALMVTSPCDCVVTQALVSPGEWLSAGTVTYLLRPRHLAAALSVRVAQDKVELLALGDRALVRLAGASVPAESEILAISRALPTEVRFGLPDTIGRDAATVTLSLPEKIPPASMTEPAAGTPAQVMFPIPPRRLLFSWTGWGG